MTAGLAVLALAIAVAAIVKRPPPELPHRPVAAVLHDVAGRPVWAIRLALGAHEIGVATLRAQPVPSGKAYQLWIMKSGAAAPVSIGLLPELGSRTIPPTPHATRLMSGSGQLIATLEPAQGATDDRPHDKPRFWAKLDAHPPAVTDW